MGWTWKGEESWKRLDSIELVAPNGADGEKDWLEKWTEGPSEDEIRMGRRCGRIPRPRTEQDPASRRPIEHAEGRADQPVMMRPRILGKRIGLCS